MIPNSRSSVEALADHQLVALLEDVERDELARQQHEPEREQREALDGRAHSAFQANAMRVQPLGMDRISRRQLIVSGALAAGALAGSPRLLREALAAPARAGASPYGPLGPPDANGLMLPPGFSSREIARGLSQVAGYPWPVFPDGQATFPTARRRLDPRHELRVAVGQRGRHVRDPLRAGRRHRDAPTGSSPARTRTAPAARTPWGTWLSCEEHDAGLVWECDPAGELAAAARARRSASSTTRRRRSTRPDGRST